MKALLKYKWLLLAIPLIIVGIWLCPKGCDHAPASKKVSKLHDKNTILSNDIIKSVSVISSRAKRLKQDSIDMAKAYQKLKSKYHNAIRQAPDTCKSWIDTIYSDALILDFTDNITIKRQDSTIKDYEVQTKKLTEITHNDTLWINHLQNDSIPKIYKSRFWKGYKKGFKHGAITGASVSEGIRAGIRLSP